MLLKDYLIAKGFETELAVDGNDGLKMFRRSSYDFLILDVMMPMVDGYATLEHIKKDSNLQHTKVMFLSAKNKESDIEKGMALGADAYLTKPFSIKKVVEQVEELLS